VSVSTQAKRSMWAQDTADGLLELVTISGGELETPLRVVNNPVAITSRGNEYIAYPFELGLPSDEEDSPPLARLAIDNVSREIAQAVRQTAGPLQVGIELVRISDTDVVEWSWPHFTLRNVRVDALTVTGDLGLHDFHGESHTSVHFTPAVCPGVF